MLEILKKFLALVSKVQLQDFHVVRFQFVHSLGSAKIAIIATSRKVTSKDPATWVLNNLLEETSFL